MKTYYAIGLMSGSSLDGLDIAYCQIDWEKDQVHDWKIIQSETLPFSEKWQNRLSGLPMQSALIFAKTDTYFGYYLAELIQQFIDKYQPPQIDFIASHGHTIFHEPDNRISIQIGSGAAIAALTGITTITDFRTQDIALEGEGAPLAPLADKYLFGGYDFYLNIGGIANLSAFLDNQWLALDTSPANQVLNTLAQLKGKDFDEGGLWASQGEVQEELLRQAAHFEYYDLPAPKSLGNAWIRKHILPVYLASEHTIEDKLATACEHIAIELAKSISRLLAKTNSKQSAFKMLLSGGGIYNDYLIKTIYEYCQQVAPIELIIPSNEIIDFKEAALMALLGVLRIEGIPNSLKSATGAKRDTVNGAIYRGQ